MADLTFKYKEAKTITVTIKNKDTGAVVDVSSATLTFEARPENGESSVITVADGAMGKGQAASGIVTIPFSSSNLDNPPGKYIGELKTQFSAANIDKSDNITIEIEGAVTD